MSTSASPRTSKICGCERAQTALFSAMPPPVKLAEGYM
jgi:hypothetical protein